MGHRRRCGQEGRGIGGLAGKAEINKVDPKALVTFQTNAEMFKDLSSSQRTLDAIVTDYLTAAQEIARTPDALKNGPPFTDAQLGIAVAKSRPDVLAAINAGLKSAADNYLVKDEVNQWLSVPPRAGPPGSSSTAGGETDEGGSLTPSLCAVSVPLTSRTSHA